MAQYPIVVPDGAGIDVRTGLCNAIMAVVTCFEGPAQPSPTYPGMPWRDTGSTPKILRMRSQDNQSWIVIGLLDQTNLGLVPLTAVSVVPSANIIPKADSNGILQFQTANDAPGGCAHPFRGSFNGKNPIDRFSSEIYTNWHICDGTDGTLDLRGRFILGSSSSHAVGSIGGSETHSQTLDELVVHHHDGLSGPIAGPVAGGGAEWFGFNGSPTTSTGNTGGGSPFSIMPPYYTLAYIERIS